MIEGNQASATAFGEWFKGIRVLETLAHASRTPRSGDGFSVIVATEHLRYAVSEVIEHDEYDLGSNS